MSQSVLEKTATIANLLAAYEGESNAHSKYVLFAAKADAEGWHGAASLFRAAARAEQIHATNHARVIKQLGAEAKCEIHPEEVKTTLENLKAALSGEQHEVNIMYPAFIREACGTDVPLAKRTFNWAMEAEKTHARLFREAIQLVARDARESWITAAREFYVCPVCGYTSERAEDEHCPVCTLAWEKFETIK